MGDQVDCLGPGGEFSSGDTAWMLTATAFVMIQTPALGLVQAGMIRRRNSLAMLLQTMAGMAIGSILWFIFGFALTFGEDHGGFIGDLDYAFFVDVDMDKCFSAGPTIPTTVYALFQMMFALMVPVIVTGAWAEKLNFRAFLLFTIIWPIFAYYPLAHWVWGGGWLSKLGVIDFAGGITIHTNAGVAALVVALVMGRRRGGDSLQDIHHNIPLTIVGGAFIWFRWFASMVAFVTIINLTIINLYISSICYFVFFSHFSFFIIF